MHNHIKCPNCGHQLDVENVLAHDIQLKFKKEYEEKIKHQNSQLETEKQKLMAEQQEFEEKKKRENEIFSQKLQSEKIKMQAELQDQLKTSIKHDFENQLRMLQESNAANEEKLKEARKKELEFLQLQQALSNKEAELEITLQKKLQEERQSITEQVRKQESERNLLKETEHQLLVKEKEKQLEEQKKLIDEMKRKAEQGSMQRQGEVQELLLEEILKEYFMHDTIEEVGKGIEGADCIQIVKNPQGVECGKIIYESKRTKTWQNNWLDKLKTDMRSTGADVAILVTQTFPKEMEKFGEREGIWICNFNEVSSVAQLLRNGILKIHEAHKSQENKGEKMQMLYNYLTGNEFKGQVEAIVEGFVAMKNSITRERIQMEKVWKEREKQIEKVLYSTAGLYGSVKGIAGASISDIPLLEGDYTEEE